MTKLKNRTIHLKSYPDGTPTPANFELISADLDDPGEGEFVVKNSWMSVDPYMRGRMSQRKSYVAGFEAGKPLDGSAIGEVIQSNNDAFPVGTLVNSQMGWREYFVSDGRGVTALKTIEGIPTQAHLSVLGGTGFTAYIGLKRIAALKDGENVFVSAAAGAVGSIACQIAKAQGCYVVGSAGSDDKCAWLENECGVDATINYKTTDKLIKEVAAKFPGGIDVYFENVGGEHLVAALELMNTFGRVALCGMISQYNATDRVPGPYNLGNAIGKEITIRGFGARRH
jgi:NADPH-dependent curcumin reductase CurA